MSYLCNVKEEEMKSMVLSAQDHSLIEDHGRGTAISSRKMG